MLKEQELHEGGRPAKNQSHNATSFERPKLEDIGIKKDQSSRWHRIAEIPEEQFEKRISVYKNVYF